MAAGSGGQSILIRPDIELIMVSLNNTGINVNNQTVHNPLAKVAPFDETWQR